MALIDETGSTYTFGDLANFLDRLPTANAPVIAETEIGLDFILATLTAWRDGQALVPVDSVAPDDALLENLPDGVAHVKITSGSTGAPRLVLFTAEQLAADADNIVATMGLRPDWPNIGVISMAHSYGFSNLVLPLLLHGIPLVLAKDALPNSVERALNRTKNGATLPAVPAMWRSWHRAGILDGEKIRLAISAGAPLTPELETAVFDDTGIKIHNFLGSSECGGIAYDRCTKVRTDGRTAGAAMKNVTIGISADGCLEVRGKAVGMGYWPDAEIGLLNGVFTTQDLASIADSGHVILEGRAGDLINVAGRKVSPAAIEAAIIEGGATELCVVFGVPSADPERVQDVIALLKNCRDLAALKKEVARRLPSWQVPRQWIMEPALAVDRRGKLSRLLWKEHFMRT